jgi:hypothetical protein
MKGLTFACLSMIAVTVQSAFAQESANPQTPSAAQPADLRRARGANWAQQ